MSQVLAKMGGYSIVETAEQPCMKTIAFDGAFESCSFKILDTEPPNDNGVCSRPGFDSGAVQLGQRRKRFLIRHAHLVRPSWYPPDLSISELNEPCTAVTIWRSGLGGCCHMGIMGEQGYSALNIWNRYIMTHPPLSSSHSMSKTSHRAFYPSMKKETHRSREQYPRQSRPAF
ncbi:galactan-beta-galactosidase [Moniliophthora roreri]|nr:galactan-beta-galactosidase [Moniliophthora roreri]